MSTEAKEEVKVSAMALAIARRIRAIPISEADTMLALFDTGVEDKANCERLIVERIAKEIDSQLAQLQRERDAAMSLLGEFDGLVESLWFMMAMPCDAADANIAESRAKLSDLRAALAMGKEK